MISEDLTNKVLAWASKVATEAAQLSSRQAREEYLAERRRELKQFPAYLNRWDSQ
jgi:hypothetical protein